MMFGSTRVRGVRGVSLETVFTQSCDKISKNDFVIIQTEMPNQNDVQTLAQNDKETSLVVSGKIKIELCRRLGVTWKELAIYLEIPSYHCSQFQQGGECQAILEWLEERKQLHTLKEALGNLDRQDLVELLNTNNKVRNMHEIKSTTKPDRF
ncbi:death domain-containing protein [Candidatus Parabeggiatoa sp. HSG14]|uniref:death domain-containing protein n=1 Tax=Candidatus Parabeggiatoa sp. HSG14 TaxID=3055593 RepID=UPI0025A8F19E|nr:death domain-containing protein [Thiotrichales bacterium HSG14]